MQRYRFAVEYDGSRFCGWQVQPHEISIQSTLEKALSTCLRIQICITGAGRTDAGVHALGQVAHFDFEGNLDCVSTINSVNALTPKDICIRRLKPCQGEFHARYSALFRHYIYRISLRPRALNRHWVWEPPCKALDTGLMARELECINGSHDFLPFSIPRNDGKSTMCKINKTSLESADELILIHIEGDRFLHKMVRSIVGACVDVARKRFPPGLVNSIFKGTFNGERTWAPAKGLCLEKVGYSDYEF
jgi:tRNA pseudouridine38-40 synthase